MSFPGMEDPAIINRANEIAAKRASESFFISIISVF
jgi:hypothetical protein